MGDRMSKLTGLRFDFLYRSFYHGDLRDKYWFTDPKRARVNELMRGYYFEIAVMLYHAQGRLA